MKELGGVRPEEFVAAAVKRGKEYADMEKRLKNLTLELMKAESEKLIAEAKASLAEGAGGGIVVYRRDDVGGDFFNALRDAIRQACPECLAVLAWGSPVATTTAGGALGRAKTGQFMVIGPTDRVESLAPSVCMALEGKGGMSKYGYRGKGNLAGWDKLVQKLLLS
ncbi:alanyl-tRNA synthetase [Trypanosoma cruzi]|nr:alanyl-tRNA synthetase [Trypanosoma cruzi]